jgi:hypothetical protein
MMFLRKNVFTFIRYDVIMPYLADYERVFKGELGRVYLVYGSSC